MQWLIHRVNLYINPILLFCIVFWHCTTELHYPKIYKGPQKVDTSFKEIAYLTWTDLVSHKKMHLKLQISLTDQSVNKNKRNPFHHCNKQDWSSSPAYVKLTSKACNNFEWTACSINIVKFNNHNHRFHLKKPSTCY